MRPSDRPDTATLTASLDRADASRAGIDKAADEMAAHARRLHARRGDRASHRAHHGLYEDMLN